MLMQNIGVTNKEYYGMLWYFLEWSIISISEVQQIHGQNQNFSFHTRFKNAFLLQCEGHILMALQ